jgi:uncharacterized protein YigA (DUF484 family)
MDEADIPKINEEIAQKFLKIEADIAACRTAVELFEALVVELEAAFGIPFVWLTILRVPETTGLRNDLATSDIIGERLNLIAKELFLEVIPAGASPLLACGHLGPFFRLMPRNRKYFVRSLAVSPITVHGKLIGSVNHGDPSPSRYEPGMDTTLLMHLAACVSDRLSAILPPPSI